MIETADRHGIATLTLNNGSVSALDLELIIAVPETLAAVADARAVVVTGSGRCFSAGVDLKRLIDCGPCAGPCRSSRVVASGRRPRWLGGGMGLDRLIVIR